ncbi:unnamed protein product (macronuclear) [Paramecium tetraurelia]|uniref:Uncharacterized protein n=1 Tax=Paramecium tetraurelia TaxID=5888 RepID=A0CTP0_PARTE|nr:uncharacterized protein GSPATT00010391001 [Paramecium tetraurelia]CAK74157.1 unnamed protein product [Paramecium tetraurelia]|eukprot:XP_001441554.1 hypothetical protein (macronuclear) [Paramecium tetraurelia strain d4-2]
MSQGKNNNQPFTFGNNASEFDQQFLFQRYDITSKHSILFTDIHIYI